MRSKTLLFILLAACCLSIYGGIHVKGNLHFDAFYDSGVQQPEEDVVYEWWFEKDRVSFVTDRWRFTLDKGQQRLLAVHRLEKFYVAMPLPLNFQSHVDQQLLENLKQYRIEGTVKLRDGITEYLANLADAELMALPETNRILSSEAMGIARRFVEYHLDRKLSSLAVME